MQSTRDSFIEGQINEEDEIEMEGDNATRFQGLTLEEFDEFNRGIEVYDEFNPYNERDGRDEGREMGNEIE